MINQKVLEIRNLQTYFYTRRGVVKALEGINLDVLAGETLGIVGETGCGKSVLALSILRLVRYPGKIVKGEIILRSKDLIKFSEEQMRKIRGSRIALIFQDPLTFINPVFTIGDQISEVFLYHSDMNFEVLEWKIAEAKKQSSSSPTQAMMQKNQIRIKKLEQARKNPPKATSKEVKKIAWDMSVNMLKLVKIPDPERVARSYPHELSGGMRQRAMIAMALSLQPDILIADEATTALDVTTQAQILKLLSDLRAQIGSTIIVITHDLGIVAQMCTRVAVMYAGTIAEVAPTKELFANPQHPYTQGLLKAVPKISGKTVELTGILGSVPDLIYPPSGCRFHPRCHFAVELCKIEIPLMIETSINHFVKCNLYGEQRKQVVS